MPQKKNPDALEVLPRDPSQHTSLVVLYELVC